MPDAHLRSLGLPGGSGASPRRSTGCSEGCWQTRSRLRLWAGHERAAGQTLVAGFWNPTGCARPCRGHRPNTGHRAAAPARGPRRVRRALQPASPASRQEPPATRPRDSITAPVADVGGQGVAARDRAGAAASPPVDHRYPCETGRRCSPSPARHLVGVERPSHPAPDHVIDVGMTAQRAPDDVVQQRQMLGDQLVARSIVTASAATTSLAWSTPVTLILTVL